MVCTLCESVLSCTFLCLLVETPSDEAGYCVCLYSYLWALVLIARPARNKGECGL